MIMSEDEEKWLKEKVKIIWVDGEALMELPPNSIIKKRQRKPVEIPHFKFGQLQQQKQREHMKEMVKELDNIFSSNINTPFFPANWKIFEIDQWGGIKEIKKEDEEDDNAK